MLNFPFFFLICLIRPDFNNQIIQVKMHSNINNMIFDQAGYLKKGSTLDIIGKYFSGTIKIDFNLFKGSNIIRTDSIVKSA
jgi:hypothetical protein